MDIGDLRAKYNEPTNVFLEQSIEIKEPLNILEKWFEEVRNHPYIIEPNAVHLSTASKDGIPSGRLVLCKAFNKEGFRFFTHYTSRKGEDLEENPHAALTFYWPPFSRQVRVEGTVEKLPFSVADEYFQSRPYGSQIGALISNQSKPIEGRHILTEQEIKVRNAYKEGQVPRPPQWGGYLLKHHTVEFWQGQTNRIHDRIRFRLSNEEPDGKLCHKGIDGWVYERLAP